MSVEVIFFLPNDLKRETLVSQHGFWHSEAQWNEVCLYITSQNVCSHLDLWFYWLIGPKGASVSQAHLGSKTAAHSSTFVQEHLLTPLSVGSVFAYLVLLEISVNPFSWIFTTFRTVFCLNTDFHANVSMPCRFKYCFFVIYLVGWSLH